ncbi:MFS general substrate transporter [Penicillium macrosclerotiorum]|uniref:MFS general substrate transporter n=1 Tax=Penicillium macrosclerotiorum TaxID=303699 RepID=UPI002547A1FB|nr:MFS general substrate transporter [Penicillium macrosclerotiorum]KAJ5689315.1 MFS general substrate transporter [Penicillium macrosclerotiorum]
MIATIATPIASSLSAASSFSWITTAYFIGSTLLQAISGHLANAYGRRKALAVNYALFSLGKFFCGLATTHLPLFLAGRALQGIGGGAIASITSRRILFLPTNVPSLETLALCSMACAHRRLDIVGMTILIVTIVLSQFGLNHGSTTFAWADAGTLAPLTGCFVSSMFCVPLYVQVFGLSAFEASLRLIPLAVAFGACSGAAGYLVVCLRRYYHLNILLLSIATVGYGLLCSLGPASSSWKPYLFLGIIGIGVGGTYVTNIMGILMSVSEENLATVQSASWAV